MLAFQNWLPLALVSATLMLLLVQHIRLRKRLSALEQQQTQRYETLGRELQATSSTGVGMGRRLVAAEKQIRKLQLTLEDLRQNDPLRVPYDEASRLVGLGADIDDLMSTCGITRPEAELVSALHRRADVVA